MRTIEPVTHGAPDFAELERLGLSPDVVLDFSVNSNPFGPSPLVRAALASVPLDRYPDRDSLLLRRALGEKLALAPEQILVGNGSAELIQLAAQAFLRPGDSALVLGPTFGEYARAAQLAGADVRQWAASPREGFASNAEAISVKLAERHRVVFICNPNNPTGQCLPAGALQTWAAAHPETLFIVDEAYLPFVPNIQSVIHQALSGDAHASGAAQSKRRGNTDSAQAPNLLILRSMTKDHALAALRLGYALGPANLIAALTAQRPPWNVNALAQAAGLAALQDPAHLAQTLIQLQKEKDLLVAGLKNIGYDPQPSQTHFFLLPVSNGADFRAALLPHGILVRDCASFSLPNHIRIAPRRPADNLRLLDVVIQKHFHHKGAHAYLRKPQADDY